MVRFMTWMLLTGTIFAAHGCQSCCKRTCPPADAASAYGACDSCVARPRFLHPLTPRGSVPAPPPGSVIVQPGMVPVAPVPIGPSPQLPVAPGPEARSYSYTPPVEPYAPPAWRPAPESNSQAAPANPPPESRLAPQRQPDPSPQPPLAQPGPNDRAGSPSSPVGIPDFRILKKDVANGLRPTHLDGLDWLKTNGYRMVLYIRAPGESDDADRKLFEDKHGMKYGSLGLSPDALTLDVAEQFNRIVADAANRPMFIYDKDGSLAGALWYLHFRMIEQQSDEDARANAARLGLKEDHREMWVAIQKVLSGRR